MKANNTQAMREALEFAEDELWAHGLFDASKRIASALAKPPRQCDVGTAEEQAERFGRYCDQFTRDGMHCETCPCCGKIPFGKCEFAWAQMPYESEAGK